MFIPREGQCKLCGTAMIQKNSNHKYCAACKKIMYSKAQGDHKKLMIAKRLARVNGIDPEKYAGLENECKVKRTCVYGSNSWCDYMEINGHSRVFTDGLEIKDGKCDAYKKRTPGRERRKAPLPDLTGCTMNSMKEV